MGNIFRQQGMTLVELTVVLLILVALAGLAVPYVMGTGSTAMCQTTDATMQAVKAAIMGGPAGTGYYADMLGKYPQDLQGLAANTTPQYNLHYLFSDRNSGGTRIHQPFNAKTGVGWHGPYLQSGGATLPSPSGLHDSFGSGTGSVFNPSTAPNGTVHVLIDNAAGSQVMDAWHRPIVLQIPYYDDDGAGPHLADYHMESARLVSAGSGTGIEPNAAAIDTLISDPIANNRNTGTHSNDDRVLFLRIPDPAVGGNTSCSDY